MKIAAIMKKLPLFFISSILRLHSAFGQWRGRVLIGANGWLPMRLCCLAMLLVSLNASGQPRVIIGANGIAASGGSTPPPAGAACTNLVLSQSDDGSNTAYSGLDTDFHSACEWFTNATEIQLCTAAFRLMSVGAGDPAINTWRYTCRDSAGTLVWQSDAFAGSASWTSPGTWVTNSVTNMPAGVCRLTVEPQGTLGAPFLYVLADFSGSNTNSRAGQLNLSGVDAWSTGTRHLGLRLIGP